MNQPLIVDCDSAQIVYNGKASSTKGPNDTPNNISPDSLFSFNHTSPPTSSDSSQLSEKCLESISPELRGYVTHASLLIGDRVLVGPAKHRGTIAYIGPTHFAAGNWAGVVLDSEKGRNDGTTHGIRYFVCPPKRGLFCRLDTLEKRKTDSLSPNTRIRMRDVTPPQTSQANGPDVRRFSLTVPNGITRSRSARLDRRQIHSVIGAVSPETSSSHSSSTSRLQRTFSDRFDRKRPHWLPPGSHDVRSSGLAPEKQKTSKLTRSKTLPGIRTHTSKSPQRKDLENVAQESSSLVRTNFPSRSPLRTDANPQLSRSLTVLNKYRGRSPMSVSSSGSTVRSGYRRRFWSGNSQDTLKSQQQYSDLLKAFTTLSMRESQAELLRKSLQPSSADQAVNIQADCVISCAQDRLMELQNQLLEVYDARTKVAEELENTKKLYEELKQAHTAKCASHHDSPSEVSSSRLEQLHTQLTKEFERTKYLWADMKKLHQRLHSAFKTQQIAQGSDFIVDSTNNPVNRKISLSDEEEDELKLREMNEFPDFKLRSPSSVITENQIRKLRMSSSQQNHYMALLGKIKVCRSVIHQNLDVLFKEQDEIDGIINRESILQKVYKRQAARLYQTKSSNHRIATELSVIRAEIAHLSSRPVKEAHFLVDKYQLTKRSTQEVAARIQTLEDTVQRLKTNIVVWKANVAQEDQRRSTLWRTNLRIYQLTQFQCKAQSLECEQTQLVERKQTEIKRLSDELNFMSRLWANERQLKFNANRQLKDKLTSLTDTSRIPTRHRGTHSQNDMSSGDESNSLMNSEMFSTLCKEIRRLQTRSAVLVDALGTLSSNSCSEERLNGIRVLVHLTSYPKSNHKASIAGKPKSEVSDNMSRSAPHLNFSSPKPDVIRRPIIRPIPAYPVKDKQYPVCIDNRSRSSYISRATPDNRSELSQGTQEASQLISSMRQLNRGPNQQFGMHLRKRPMSFYMHRPFEPAIDGSIPEADEDQENEESF